MPSTRHLCNRCGEPIAVIKLAPLKMWCSKCKLYIPPTYYRHWNDKSPQGQGGSTGFESGSRGI